MPIERDYRIIDIDGRDLNISYTGNKITLPQEIQETVDKHWEDISAGNKHFFNGEIFTIESFEEANHELNIKISKTDFAHYIATRRKIITDNKYQCHVAYGTIVVKTSDDYFIMGETSADTAHPNRLQFIGGAIDNNDIAEDGRTIDITKNAVREMKEELGLEINGAELNPLFLKFGGNNRNSIGVIFLINSELDSSEIKSLFNANNQRQAANGELVEMNDLTFLKADINAIDEFKKTNTKEIKSYMLDVLRRATPKA